MSESLTRGCCNILSPSCLCYKLRRGMENNEEHYIVQPSATFFHFDNTIDEMVIYESWSKKKNQLFLPRLITLKLWKFREVRISFTNSGILFLNLFSLVENTTVENLRYAARGVAYWRAPVTRFGHEYQHTKRTENSSTFRKQSRAAR